MWVLLLVGVEYASSICGFLKVRDLFLYFRRPNDAPCSFRWACLVYGAHSISSRVDEGNPNDLCVETIILGCWVTVWGSALVE